MTQEIIMGSTPEEVRMGLVEDGVLQEYLVERAMSAHLVGSIFLGRVSNVVPGIQAAFVDIGLEQNAFLYLGESRDLTEGMSVMVQITKDPRGTKGPTASREITFPGRYVVLFPQAGTVGVSRRIHDSAERDRLHAIAERLRPGQMGLVVRTAAEGVPTEVIEADIASLLTEWHIVGTKAKRTKAPAFLHRELDLSVRMVRDYLNKDVDRIVLDSAEAYERVKALLDRLPAGRGGQLTLYTGADDVFAAYGLADAVASLSDRRVDLPGGGYLILDHTEAMTVIDVNSGSYSGKNNLEETIMEINRQAAREIAHQLRLRDIGGIIVVDFIDMHSGAHRQELLSLLEKAFRGDRMRPRIQDITVLNLVEITRKKSRQNLEAVLYTDCPTCNGTGRVQSKEAIALEIKRRLRSLLKKQGSSRDILLVAHPVEAEYLQQCCRDWNRELACHLKVESDPSLHVEAFLILDNG
ncbi:MAG: Rne/Rng family ribonuclease [Succiniclasticum sp.]|jgi:ribonuclease G|nr:Rne/Rng family ribonuclease [Succiniclasticum sp.]MDY2870134.1 Rne/Rng family ribonuclease [Succiniclasticum sp.]MDY6302857.1 Rne/Rng family ribonuclease [Succiniclasticum sp.]MDY6345565.1 Rne/Rng family ribonuclease [Succiniclasticum sp.]